MNFTATYISYRETGSFSHIVTDYIDGAAALKEFYAFPPDLSGLKQAVTQRQEFAVNRSLLAEQLKLQYSGTATADAVKSNIDLLLSPDTFTICTAHQPNIFTGHLYFIYKILHTIKLAAYCKEQMPMFNFVPVYYMGSEDADLDELGQVYADGITYQWQTKQKGAVGRMLVDDALLKMLEELAGRLLVEPHGPAVVELLRLHYAKGTTIEKATFTLVNSLFAEYGLVVLLPDNAALKQTMQGVFEDDLLQHQAEAVVAATSERLDAAGYKPQAYPRPVNLFYLEGDTRERIEQEGAHFRVVDNGLVFSKTELLELLRSNPERFSPNVILRGLYQETILPNIAFIGGGGELAYWLQLKDLFVKYRVNYPLLVLRNSFLIIDEQAAARIEKLRLGDKDLFLPAAVLHKQLVQQQSNAQLTLDTEKEAMRHYYEKLQMVAGHVDNTLQRHVAALGVQATKKLDALEKKLLRAEKRKFDAENRQIEHLKAALFPKGSLQEREDNYMYYMAKMGAGLLTAIYNASLATDARFTIIKK